MLADGTAEPHQFEEVNQLLLVAPAHTAKEGLVVAGINETLKPEPPPPCCKRNSTVVDAESTPAHAVTGLPLKARV